MKKLLKILSEIFPHTGAYIYLALFLRPPKIKRPKKETKAWNEGEKVKLSPWVQGRLYNPGQEKLVVFIHGWAGRGSQFYKYIEPLSKEAYSILLIDGPAHGDSKGARTNLVSFSKQIAKDLSVYEDRLYAVVGHSFGGMATLLTAYFGLKAKKRVIIGTPYQTQKVMDVFFKRFGLNKIAAKEFVSLLEDETKTKVKEIDNHPHFSPEECSLLIIHDENDKEVPIQRASQIASAYPGSECFFTQGLGHYRILYNEKVIEQVKKFLNA